MLQPLTSGSSTAMKGVRREMGKCAAGVSRRRDGRRSLPSSCRPERRALGRGSGGRGPRERRRLFCSFLLHLAQHLVVLVLSCVRTHASLGETVGSQSAEGRTGASFVTPRITSRRTGDGLATRVGGTSKTQCGSTWVIAGPTWRARSDTRSRPARNGASLCSWRSPRARSPRFAFRRAPHHVSPRCRRGGVFALASSDDSHR